MKRLLLIIFIFLCFILSTSLSAQQPIEEFIGQDVVVNLSSDSAKKDLTGKLVAANEYGIIISVGAKKTYINHDFIVYIEAK